MDEMEQGAWRVVETLERAGYEAYLVGGCVRDKLIQRPLCDYDITTSARPDDVLRLFEQTVPTGIRHGTVSVLLGGFRYEVTTFRTDGEYEDGRRPQEVVFVRSLTEDLARRDYTINAMALGRDGVLHDPFGGRSDLQRQVVRAVGEPAVRFAEDALRMLRGIRFAAQLRFEIEDRTLQAIGYESQSLRLISRERVRDEWHKMLLAAPDLAIPLLQQTDTLRHILSRPQTFDLQVEDPWGWGIDPWRLAGDWAARAPQDLALRYALLFTAVRMDEARIEKTLAELRLSTRLKQEVRTTLLFAGENPNLWQDAQWRQQLFRHGDEGVWRGCCLFAAMHEPDNQRHWQEQAERRKSEQPLWSLQDLAATGDDLIAAGLPAGPLVGRTLQRLAQWVLLDPSRNDRDRLIRQALQWREEQNL